MQERDQYLLLVIPTKHGRSNEPAKRVGVGLVFNASTGADGADLADAGIIWRALACAENSLISLLNQTRIVATQGGGGDSRMQAVPDAAANRGSA